MRSWSLWTAHYHGQLRDVYFFVGGADPGADVDFVQRPG